MKNARVYSQNVAVALSDELSQLAAIVRSGTCDVLCKHMPMLANKQKVANHLKDMLSGFHNKQAWMKEGVPSKLGWRIVTSSICVVCKIKEDASLCCVSPLLLDTTALCDSSGGIEVKAAAASAYSFEKTFATVEIICS